MCSGVGGLVGETSSSHRTRKTRIRAEQKLKKKKSQAVYVGLEKELDLKWTNLFGKPIGLALCLAHLQPSFLCVIVFKRAICGPTTALYY